jgi:hypothetical protein
MCRPVTSADTVVNEPCSARQTLGRTCRQHQGCEREQHSDPLPAAIDDHGAAIGDAGVLWFEHGKKHRTRGTVGKDKGVHSGVGQSYSPHTLVAYA